MALLSMTASCPYPLAKGTRSGGGGRTAPRWHSPDSEDDSKTHDPTEFSALLPGGVADKGDDGETAAPRRARLVN